MNKAYIESLVSKAKLGDKISLNIILKEFTPTIIKYSSSIYLSSYSIEDLIQEWYVYLFNIIEKYNPNKSSFKTYANISLKNNYNYLIRKNAKYHKELSYNKPINSDKGEMNYLLENEFFKNVLYNSLKDLDKKECNVLIHYYFKDESLKEFALKNNMAYHHCVRLKNTALYHLREKFERAV